jgi:Alkylmercury lyase/Bacterial regulatory proteins, gntR family
LEDSSLRLHIYEGVVRTGEVPTVASMARSLGASREDVRVALRRLDEAHILVLQPSGEVLMANPFSAVPTPFVTEAGSRRWFANCIWDALGILGALHCDGRVLTSCGCCGDGMSLTVNDGLVGGEGVAHFALPARRWWEDIVFN